jgi:hypothetical protein
VYLLISHTDPTRHYTGCTTDLAKRIYQHNNGDVSHTSANKPWRYETVIRFSSAEKARAFASYPRGHLDQLRLGLWDPDHAGARAIDAQAYDAHFLRTGS